MRIGIDDFARRILGRIDRIEVAPAGSDLGLRDAALVLHRGGKSAAFAAPVEEIDLKDAGFCTACARRLEVGKRICGFGLRAVH